MTVISIRGTNIIKPVMFYHISQELSQYGCHLRLSGNQYFTECKKNQAIDVERVMKRIQRMYFPGIH